MFTLPLSAVLVSRILQLAVLYLLSKQWKTQLVAIRFVGIRHTIDPAQYCCFRYEQKLQHRCEQSHVAHVYMLSLEMYNRNDYSPYSAGIESPSHALRADASPFAVSASSVWISLAEEYSCDRAVEIILHPSGK